MADMAEDMRLDDFKRWKVDILRRFCQDRGFPVGSKKKDELVALAYAAHTQKLPVLPSKADEKAAAQKQYADLLTLADGTVISDPLQIKSDEWLCESDGLRHWPPCMVMNISEYLIANNEQPLCTRLRNDYKEGKAFSYFASEESWIKEVQYHALSDSLCVLRSKCVPSQRVSNIPHTLWVCFQQHTGTIERAYCTCMAGLGSTCNHVAALLFKVDYAWQHGLTEACSKPCTSGENLWISPSLAGVDPVKASDMVLQNPRKRFKRPVNPAVRESVALRSLFSPVRSRQDAVPRTLEDIAEAVFPECSDGVVFRYGFSDYGAQYKPFADVNVCETINCALSPYH